MKMVYTHENRMVVGNAQNILEAQGIEILLKNEFMSGAIGELSPFDTWVELWVINDSDYKKASHIIENALSEKGTEGWVCKKCMEENDASFEICWKCQSTAAEIL